MKKTFVILIIAAFFTSCSAKKNIADIEYISFLDICMDSIGKPCGAVVIDGRIVDEKITKIDKNAIKEMSVLQDMYATFSNPKPVLLISTHKKKKLKNIGYD